MLRFIYCFLFSCSSGIRSCWRATGSGSTAASSSANFSTWSSSCLGGASLGCRSLGGGRTRERTGFARWVARKSSSFPPPWLPLSRYSSGCFPKGGSRASPCQGGCCWRGASCAPAESIGSEQGGRLWAGSSSRKSSSTPGCLRSQPCPGCTSSKAKRVWSDRLLKSEEATASEKFGRLVVESRTELHPSVAAS